MFLFAVLDANDNAPVFDDPSYEVRVQENVPRGTRILKVHASDADMGRNSEIAYSISSSTAKLVRDIFDIDSETGELHLKSELDREVKDVHKIWITARDKAVSSNMESTVLATVLVDDLNDNPPLIDISYFPQEASAAFIAEDAPIGTFVALVRLKDADTGINARAVCSLQSDTFALKQQSEDTYAIITSKLLDRERREEYLLELTAKDQGKPSLESRTTLQVSGDQVAIFLLRCQEQKSEQFLCRSMHCSKNVWTKLTLSFFSIFGVLHFAVMLRGWVPQINTKRQRSSFAF